MLVACRLTIHARRGRNGVFVPCRHERCVGTWRGLRLSETVPDSWPHSKFQPLEKREFLAAFCALQGRSVASNAAFLLSWVLVAWRLVSFGLLILPPIAAAGKFAVFGFAADGGFSVFHCREKKGEAGFKRISMVRHGTYDPGFCGCNRERGVMPCRDAMRCGFCGLSIR